MRKYTIIFVILFTCGIGDIFHEIGNVIKSDNVIKNKGEINWGDFRYTGIN